MGMQAQPGAQAIPRANPMKPVWIVLASLAFLTAAVWGLSASGFLKQSQAGRSADAIRAAGAERPSDAIRLEGESQAPDMLAQRQQQQPTNSLDLRGERKVMPDDVRKWLEHLERIEKMRGDLSVDQLGHSMSKLVALKLGGSLEMLKSLINDPTGENPMPSPAEETIEDFGAMREQWVKLNQQFHSLPPPAECIPIRDAYDICLNETGAMIVEINETVKSADENTDKALSTLLGMQGDSEKRIGEPAKRTDRGVADICHKYETRKWFGISADFGGGMISKIGF